MTPEINAVCTVLIALVTLGVIVASLLQKNHFARWAEDAAGPR